MGQMTILVDKEIDDATAEADDNSWTVRLPMAREWRTHVRTLECKLHKTPDSVFTSIVASRLGGMLGLKKVNFGTLRMKVMGRSLDTSGLADMHRNIDVTLHRLPPNGEMNLVKKQFSDEVTRTMRTLLHKNILGVGGVECKMTFADGTSYSYGPITSDEADKDLLASDFAYFRTVAAEGVPPPASESTREKPALVTAAGPRKPWWKVW